MSTFRVGGLASGLDTHSIIDAMLQAEKRPVALLQQRQEGIRSRISALGTIAGRIDDFSRVAEEIKNQGVSVSSVMSENTSFAARASGTALPASYSINVESTASAAKAHSDSFSERADPVRSGILTIIIEGEEYIIEKEEGDSLDDIAWKVGNSGAGVQAQVLDTGNGFHLFVSRDETGFRLGEAPSDSLQIIETDTGGSGQMLNLHTPENFTEASNAVFSVDGLFFQRRTNLVTDALPGISLEILKESNDEELLVVERDADSTVENLQEFIDSYNSLMRELERHLRIDENTDRNRTLSGDASIQGLQRRLQSLVTESVVSEGAIRNMVDIGIRTEAGGGIGLDRTRLESAMNADSDAVEELFGNLESGIGALALQLKKDYTDPSDGILNNQRKGLDRNIREIDFNLERMQYRIDARRETLFRQFAAMEQMVARFQNIGNYLFPE